MWWSGTSHGKVDNNFPTEGFPQETHFDLLDAHNIRLVASQHTNDWELLPLHEVHL